MYELKTKETDT